MKNLKTFLDVTGKRVTRGEPVSTGYDKDTLAHYKRLGLIGESDGSKPAAPGKRPRQPKPTETKPAAPQEQGQAQPEQPEFPPEDPDEKGGENNPLTEADAEADLAGEPRPT